ncbi:MAG: hypothetical protein LBH48_02080, partial [Bifidobacteriaceae bacterium]|nr:hypothetical protein [Bifidobacteriaceae bacterium]
LPRLDGASAQAAKAFDTRVTAIVRAEEASLAKAKRCKDPKKANPPAGELTITYHGSIYDGRYASVTLLVERARPRCSNLDYTVPKSFTLDLNTRKAVKFSKFVSSKGKHFDAAVVASMRTKKQNPDCYKQKSLRKVRPPLNKPHAWNVTDAGVRVWYRGNASVGSRCAYITGFVPWKSVLTPADLKSSKTRTTYWAFGLKQSESSRYGYTGKVAMARTRGNQVVLFEWNLSKSSGRCQVGVRHNKRAIVYEAGKAGKVASITMNNATSKAVPKKYVSQGRKATKAEIAAIFTRVNGLNASSINRRCQL